MIARMNGIGYEIISIFVSFDLHLIGKWDHMADTGLEEMVVWFEDTFGGDCYEVVSCGLFFGLFVEEAEYFVFDTWGFVDLHLLVDLHMPYWI